MFYISPQLEDTGRIFPRKNLQMREPPYSCVCSWWKSSDLKFFFVRLDASEDRFEHGMEAELPLKNWILSFTGDDDVFNTEKYYIEGERVCEMSRKVFERVIFHVMTFAFFRSGSNSQLFQFGTWNRSKLKCFEFEPLR